MKLRSAREVWREYQEVAEARGGVSSEVFTEIIEVDRDAVRQAIILDLRTRAGRVVIPEDLTIGTKAGRVVIPEDLTIGPVLPLEEAVYAAGHAGKEAEREATNLVRTGFLLSEDEFCAAWDRVMPRRNWSKWDRYNAKSRHDWKALMDACFRMGLDRAEVQK